MEMKELMINNYVVYQDKIFQIKEEDGWMIYEEHMNFHPIVLNDDILSELGFENDGRFCRKGIISLEHSFPSINNMGDITFVKPGIYLYLKYLKVEYVHQLQNLCYILENMKLTFK